MLVYPNLVYPGYAGTVMSVHPDPVNPSQLLYRHLAPTRGLPPDRWREAVIERRIGPIVEAPAKETSGSGHARRVSAGRCAIRP